MPSTSRPAPPAKLGNKAKKLWQDTVKNFELRIDELRVLEDVCREVDLIERLEKEISKEGSALMVKGSMGQLVANPLIQEIRQHRALVSKLLSALKLPEEDDSAGAAARSSQARAAANARWRMSGTS